MSDIVGYSSRPVFRPRPFAGGDRVLLRRSGSTVAQESRGSPACGDHRIHDRNGARATIGSRLLARPHDST